MCIFQVVYLPDNAGVFGVHECHAQDSITMGRYGKRYQPRVLLDSLGKLDYGLLIPKQGHDCLAMIQVNGTFLRCSI